MTSEIRANTLKNRVGLGTVSFTNTGPVVSGIVTIRNSTAAGVTLEDNAGVGNSLKITTPTGYVSIGSGNATFVHLNTDRGLFYFQKRIIVDEGIIGSYDEDLVLQSPMNTNRMTINKTTGLVSIVNDLDVDGHTNLDNVSIAGVTTVANTLYFNDNVYARFGTDGDASVWHDNSHLRFNNGTGNFNIQSDDFQITDSSNTTLRFRVDADGATYIRHNGLDRLITSNAGVSFPRDIDVDGHTNLDNVSIAGVTTFSSNINVTGSGSFTKTSNNYILVGSSNAGGASLVLDGDSNGDGSGTDYAYIEHDSSGNLNIVGDNPANASNIIFKTNSSTERLRIKSDGRVVIGGDASGTQPSATVGGAQFFGGSYPGDFRISSGAGASGTESAAIGIMGSNHNADIANGANYGASLNLYNYNTTDTNSTSVSFHNSNGLASSRILGQNVSHSSRTGDIIFMVSNGSHPVQQMRLRRDGKLQIGNGTVTTSGTLNVKGNAVLDDGTNARITLQADGTSTNQILSTTTNFGSYCNMKYQAADHIFLYGGNERFRIRSSGGLRSQCAETYTAVNIGECDTNLLALNLSPVRGSVTKSIAMGSIGASGSMTSIQAFDTSNDSANSLALNPLGGSVGVNVNGTPSATFEVGSSIGGDYCHTKQGWAQRRTFSALIVNNETRWYKIVNYDAGGLMIGRLEIYTSRNGGYNQTKGYNEWRFSYNGYNNDIYGTGAENSSFYAGTATSVDIVLGGSPKNIYIKIPGSIYGGRAYFIFEGTVNNWQFDESTYLTSAP